MKISEAKNFNELEKLKARMEVFERERKRKAGMTPEQKAKEVERTRRALYGAKT